MAKICYFSGKNVSVRQKLLSTMMESTPGKGFLHIVPTKGRVMELETDPKFWIKREVNTLTGVIHRIFEEDIRPEKYTDHFAIDPMLSEMLIKKVLTERAKGDQGLYYFNTLFTADNADREFAGICRNILNFISTIYQNNYEDRYANDLGSRMLFQEDRLPGSSDERYALEEDLLWLMGDYEELKREIRGYDSDDIYKNVRDFLKEKTRPSCIIDKNIIILDSLAHITRIEEEILYHLIEGSHELWWLIDYDSSTDDLIREFKIACGSEARRGILKIQGGQESCRAYYSLISLIERLHENGMPHTVKRADDVSYPNPYAGILYSNRKEQREKGGTSLKIGAFATQSDEVRAIASKIKYLLCGKETNSLVRPGQIRVIFPDLTRYASLVTEIFSEYGLPYSLTKGIPLSSHPLSDLFLRIIQLPLYGFKRRDIFSLFSSALIRPEFMGFDLPEFSPGIFLEELLLPGDTPDTAFSLMDNATPDNLKIPDIHLFDTVMRRCGMESLGKRIENIADERMGDLKAIYIAAISGKKGQTEIASLKKEYYQFLFQRHVFKEIFEPFITLLTPESPEKIIEKFKEITALLGFPVNIIDINKSDSALEPEMKRGLLKRDIRAFTLLNELLITCQREIKLAQRLFSEEKGGLTALFYKAYRNRINDSYLLDERNPDVIRVSQWLETRGRSFDYLFAGGLTSGSFPFRERPDFIIPEASRGLFRVIDHVDQSKQLFSSILKNYEKGLFLSYPMSVSEKPVQPSQVIQDLSSLIKGDNDKSAPDALIWEPEEEYTSGSDLLNAARVKPEKADSIEQTDLKNIVLKNGSDAEDIIRGIKSFASRSAANGLFEYDGVVKDAPAFFNFKQKQARAFSASTLETIANCPMRYLFQNIYNMKEPDEILADATKRDVGNLAHEVLSRLYKKFATLNTNISHMGILKAYSIAGQIIEPFIKENSSAYHLDFDEFFIQELFAGLNPETMGEGRRGVIASLLHYENEEFANRIPAGVEYEFGNGKTAVTIGDIIVKGYIDRFDRDTNSPDTLHIYDYKTGQIKPSSNIKKGLAFQLPLYIRAIQAGEKGLKISASFYSLKREAFLDNDALKQHVSSNAPASGGVDIAGVTLIDEFTLNLIRLLENGLFHHSADGLTCEYCAYRYACHKNERRMDYLVETSPDQPIYSGERNLKRWQGVDDFRKEWKAIMQSMEKAESLKTPSARKRHLETVIDYRNDLTVRKDNLPFTVDYMDNLMEELERFISRNSQLHPE